MGRQHRLLRQDAPRTRRLGPRCSAQLRRPMAAICRQRSDRQIMGRQLRRSQSHIPRPRARNRMLHLRPCRLLSTPGDFSRTEETTPAEQLWRIPRHRLPRQKHQDLGFTRHAHQNPHRPRQLGPRTGLPSRRQVPSQRQRRQNDTMLGPGSRRQMREDG